MRQLLLSLIFYVYWQEYVGSVIETGLFVCNLTYLVKLCKSTTFVDNPAKSIATRQISSSDELILETMDKGKNQF